MVSFPILGVALWLPQLSGEHDFKMWKALRNVDSFGNAPQPQVHPTSIPNGYNAHAIQPHNFGSAERLLYIPAIA
jgi:hypothetical protein